MKILSICIPCGAATKSIHGVIESCLIMEEEIEIVIIKNNISDKLQEDIEYWQNKYPETIIQTENQNYFNDVHGLYMKVVSPTSIIVQSTIVQIVATIKDLVRVQANLDFIVCDYEYTTSKRKKDICQYSGHFVVDEPSMWHQVKNISSVPPLLTLSVIFKTAIVKNELKTVSDFHCYSIYALAILPVAKATSFLYIDRVFEISSRITSEEYSKEIDRGIILCKKVIDDIDLQEIKSRKARNYITKHIVLLFSQVMNNLMSSNDENKQSKHDEFLSYFKSSNYVLYCYCKKSINGKILASNSKIASKLLVKNID